MKRALAGVHRKGPVSVAFAFAPRAGQQANGSPSLIEDTLPLPALLLLRSKSYLNQLYASRQLSAREIASLSVELKDELEQAQQEVSSRFGADAKLVPAVVRSVQR